MNDAAAIFRALNIPFVESGEHHHVREGWLGLDCPLCSPNAQKYRLGFNKTGRYFSCWICGPQSAYEMICELAGVSGRAASQIVGEIKGGEYTRPQKTPHRGKLKLPAGLTGLLPQHVRYLKARKLDAEKITRQWGLQGLGPLAGRLAWRVFIPITNKGEVVSWTTRSISPTARRRYVSASPQEESIHHKSLLFGSDHARHAIVINEGPINALTIGPGGVATLGVDYTQLQFLKMTKFPVRAICFDNEPDAQRRARKLLNQFIGLPGESYNIILESGKDLNAADPTEVDEIRKKFLY